MRWGWGGGAGQRRAGHGGSLRFNTLAVRRRGGG